MALNDLVSHYWKDCAWAIAIIASLIEFSPIKFNPLSWLAKKIGNAFNKDLVAKIDNVENTLVHRIASSDERYAVDLRVRILQFSDDLQNGINYSQSHFEQVLRDITDYNNYCNAHPDFKNNVTVHNAQLIEEIYDEKLRNGSFL